MEAGEGGETGEAGQVGGDEGLGPGDVQLCEGEAGGGAAFENLLKEGQNGDVMAVWKDCPPYFIPDTSMALFIAYTTCAMMFRFTPGIML